MSREALFLNWEKNGTDRIFTKNEKDNITLQDTMTNNIEECVKSRHNSEETVDLKNCIILICMNYNQ